MAPSTGHFVLHSSFKPPVTAGTYELVAELPSLPFDVEPGRTTIRVSSPRYSMPTDQIISSFPPANAVGAFGDRLPQIVLKRRTLPWERNPAGGANVSDTPWLALVVVAEAEAELSTPVAVAECITAGAEIEEPTDVDVEQGVYLAVTRTVVEAVFPTEEDLPLLVHVREVDITDTELAGGDDDGWLAVVMANRLPVHDEATDTPVRYLACLINLEGQLDVLPPAPALATNDAFGWNRVQDWSILVDTTDSPDVWIAGGGKVPEGLDIDTGPLDPIDPVPPPEDPPGRTAGPRGGATRSTAAGSAVSGAGQQVVFDAGPSLDGSSAQGRVAAAGSWAAEATVTTTTGIAKAAGDPDAGLLVRMAMSQGFRYPVEQFAQEEVHRFPVLAHWSFTTNGGDTFETLMQNLDVGLLGTVPVDDPPADEPTARGAGRTVPSPPGRGGPRVMGSGHRTLEHHTRRGDITTAWYRGPLVPHPTRRGTLIDDRVAHSADQLRLVVPDGHEDLSYAAAFEIGRLLGLSQLSIVGALLRLRQDHFGAARVRRRLAQSIPFDIDDVLIDPVQDLGHLLSTRFVGQLGTAPIRFAGPRRPIADPGRPIPGLSGLSTARLDEVVATGLGLDIDRIRDEAARIGAAAALARTDVPVASFDTVPVDQAVDLLRTSLEREVVRLANIARPSVIDGRTDEGDAIDELDRRLRGVAPPPGEDDDEEDR
jgi:hypothetical protein